jgi:hypothetical protein
MSAFIVSNKHINAIVSWSAANNYGRRPSLEECHDAGRMLMAENCKSVGYRYAHIPGMVQECADALEGYAFKPDTTKRSAVEIIKACECLAYQSSEHDEWESSEAKRLLDTVKDRAIDKLPGYDAAPWGIN